MYERISMAGALSLALGCSGGSVVPGAAQLTVSLQVEAIAPGEVGAHLLVPQERLHSGTRLALKVAVSRPAHVSVLWFSRRGWSRVLFPAGSREAVDQQVAAGQPVRIPPGDSRVVLGNETGEETFYVVAAERPLRQADAAFCRRYRLPCGGSNDGIPDSARSRGDEPPPEGPDPSERPPDLRALERERTVSVRPGPDGVAVLRFSMQHVD